MKVAITTKKELNDPHLELNINLDAGTMCATLTYTCAKCGGYGCHHSGHCDDHINLEPGDILDTLGEDSKPILQKLFATILAGK
jgi:hypothetical protein